MNLREQTNNEITNSKKFSEETEQEFKLPSKIDGDGKDKTDGKKDAWREIYMKNMENKEKEKLINWDLALE
ncbi:unnamed protein product [Blepharisma stoltei]|uniref:Uncharacterized protein n=1 Tax=Blepharisma stoltei TaxID=1481888 RepID=A0AAU9J9N4_9CILI|nr:unnamed protein product [Blepharisma stoltei]